MKGRPQAGGPPRKRNGAMDRGRLDCDGINRTTLAIASLCLLVVAGCSASFPFTRNEFGKPLPQDAGTEEVVKRLNRNIEGVQSWQSYDVSISGPTLPIHLSGRIFVERPRNFRLFARVLDFDEADFGSNNDVFWFWIKGARYPDGKNYVCLAHHEDIEHSPTWSQEIPFQPDWLMEVLSVVPIDPQQVKFRHGESRNIGYLESERLSPAGRPVKKVIRVDMGRSVILAHHLYDASGNLIAKAVLDHHKRVQPKDARQQDPSKFPIMPHHIALEWPQARLQINLDIRYIEANPSSIQPGFWEVPNKEPMYPTRDIVRDQRDSTSTLQARAPRRGGGHRRSRENSAPSFEDQPADSIQAARGENVGRAVVGDDSMPEWAKPIEPASAAEPAARPLSVDDFGSAPSPRRSASANAPSATRPSAVESTPSDDAVFGPQPDKAAPQPPTEPIDAFAH